MNRRELIRQLAILPVAANVLPEALAGTIEPVSSDPSLLRPQDDSLHSRAFVMDGHVHVMTRQLLEGSDIGQRYKDGSVDLPRAREGGLDAMFFSVYTPEEYYPGRFETKNTFRVLQLAIDQIKKNSSMIELAKNADDIRDINRRGKMAAFLDLEGGYDMDGDLHLLRALYTMGLRSLQLTAHNKTNAFIDACNDVRKWNGINDHGKKVIAEMNELGMVINVAHASMEAIIQTAAVSKHPVIYSHGGFYSIVNHPRCISDEAARAIAAKGGVIGIHFGSLFNNPEYYEWERSKQAARAAAAPPRPAPPASAAPAAPRPQLSLETADARLKRQIPLVFKGTIPDEYWMHVDQLAKVIDYGVKLVGEDHVALGSDFDGGPELPREIKDISDYPQITLAMQRLGYKEDRIRKILGLNWLRVIEQCT